ncbi:MAG TPA: hypothetical protein DEP37_11780 [Algoriphagus sp.]|nr:hypothetical protein [Algoriphagus sp.]|tara:strand:+ start:122 stop:1126 length:1005 start_codon:yes stop_codon:yes gene_type:complete
MSNDMKLIVENWRKNLAESEGFEKKPEKFKPQKIAMTGNFYDLLDDEPLANPVSDEGKIESVNVKEFLDFFAPIQPEAQFYDKMDMEIDNALENFFVTPLKKKGIDIPQDKKEKIAKFIGKTFRGTLGGIIGAAGEAIIPKITEKVFEYTLTIFQFPAWAVSGGKHIAAPIVSKIITTIGGQYVTEHLEERVSQRLKFNIQSLGKSGTDASVAFSVSEPVGKLIKSLQDEHEEKLASTMLQLLSRQLMMIQTAIKAETDKIEKEITASGGSGYEMMAEISDLYKTSLSELPNYDGEVLSANRIALNLVAKSIGVKKVELAESKQRRRIIYRGKK